MEYKNNFISYDNNNIKKESTFNKLKNLQILLKKESVLKVLYSTRVKNTEKDIENICEEIYKIKIDILNALKNEDNLVHYEFIENTKDYLKDLNFYIPKLLSYLWENPSLIAKLLIYSNIEDVKLYMAPLICNNFYDNILSPNSVEEPLIYIIYLLLENEIGKLNNIDEAMKFLNDTPCGYLLDELIDKKDIKAFFKIILKDIIENLELSNSEDSFCFDVNLLKKETIQKDNNQKEYSKEEQKINNIFLYKYIMDLSLKKLKELKNKYISEFNNKMEKYIVFQLKNQNNEEIYSNKKFLEEINNDILYDYGNNFFKVINFIDSLLDNIL